jgi:hypothetical protein
LHVLATGVTGTVEVLRRRSWRVLGTWVEVLGAIGALWAALIAVGEHLPFAVVAMGYLLGQIAQVIPVPGGIGAIDAGVISVLVLYGADFSPATAGELIAHGLALILPLLAGAVPFALLPREIDRTRHWMPPRLRPPRPSVRAGWPPRSKPGRAARPTGFEVVDDARSGRHYSFGVMTSPPHAPLTGLLLASPE